MTSEAPPRSRLRWVLRLALVVFCLLAIAVISITNQYLTARFTESTRNRAEIRLTQNAVSLNASLDRNSLIPQLLGRDPEIIAALNTNDHRRSSQRIMELVRGIDAVSLVLYDRGGRVVAANDRNRIGENHRNEPQYFQAVRANTTVFTLDEREGGGYAFYHSTRVEDQGRLIGVIASQIDPRDLVSGWASTQDAVLVTDSEGTIIMSTEPRWRGLEEGAALAVQSAPSAIERAIRIATQDWPVLPVDGYLLGEAVLRQQIPVGFQGWRMVGYTAYASVRERVNAILALEIMGFAILLATGFWLSARRIRARAQFFQRESVELRALNLRLQREIAKREKVERNLESAEQTLAQSSKLAVLGEMSAAVSHELNQPLAAMKTYLAGARLLLERKLGAEALASFQRIDDLIDRMGAITRQLKSYARKGSEAFEPVDTRAAISSALAMMEPQLKTRKVKITRTLPAGPVMILGDRLRLEQVIINLLRNAIDATRQTNDPQIEIILAAGDTVRLTIRDNGPGIEDLDALFEPFYTTKEPGDGVGLGLAISSGIVNDLGGRLTARNGKDGGAVFELLLPIMGLVREAAE